jgi:hypothetical protein
MSKHLRGVKKLVEISPGLFLGNKSAAADRELLLQLGVTHIVNIGGGKERFTDTFTYLKFGRILDQADAELLPLFLPACHFIGQVLGQAGPGSTADRRIGGGGGGGGGSGGGVGGDSGGGGFGRAVAVAGAAGLASGGEHINNNDNNNNNNNGSTAVDCSSPLAGASASTASSSRGDHHTSSGNAGDHRHGVGKAAALLAARKVKTKKVGAGPTGAVLLHCKGGISRSPSLLCAYLMWSGAFASLDHALAHVRSRRPAANPNAGFMAQLRLFEQQLAGAAAAGAAARTSLGQ